MNLFDFLTSTECVVLGEAAKDKLQAEDVDHLVGSGLLAARVLGKLKLKNAVAAAEQRWDVFVQCSLNEVHYMR